MWANDAIDVWIAKKKAVRGTENIEEPKLEVLN